MEELLRGDIIKYGIIFGTVFAVAIKVIQTFIYIKLMEESENIPASKNKLIKQMKLKFENCYKLNLGVNNVHVFVDKYMYKYKIGRVSMYQLYRIPIVACWLCGSVGVLSGLICYLENYSVKLGSLYEIYGVGSVLVLKLVDVILDTDYKKKMATTNLVDFFENSLQNHLMQAVAKPEVFTEEETNTMEEIPVIQEVRREKDNKESVLKYHKKEKTKTVDTKTVDAKTEETKNAEAIIEDVLSQFLS